MSSAEIGPSFRRICVWETLRPRRCQPGFPFWEPSDSPLYIVSLWNTRPNHAAHVARTAESLGWAWTYWQFDSDFIVYDIDKEQWIERVRKALVPSKEREPASRPGWRIISTMLINPIRVPMDVFFAGGADLFSKSAPLWLTTN